MKYKLEIVDDKLVFGFSLDTYRDLLGVPELTTTTLNPDLCVDSAMALVVKNNIPFATYMGKPDGMLFYSLPAHEIVTSPTSGCLDRRTDMYDADKKQLTIDVGSGGDIVSIKKFKVFPSDIYALTVVYHAIHADHSETIVEFDVSYDPSTGKLQLEDFVLRGHW